MVVAALISLLGVWLTRGSGPASEPISTSSTTTASSLEITSFSVTPTATGENITLHGTTPGSGVFVYGLARLPGTNTWWVSNKVTSDKNAHWSAVVYVPLKNEPVDASATFAPGSFGTGNPNAYLQELEKNGPPAGAVTAATVRVG